MTWHPPLSDYADDTGTAWRVHKAWHGKEPEEYLLEVLTPGRAGVRGAHLNRGRFELLPEDDPQLPALRIERQHGVIVSYRPHMRAIIKAEGRYIKVFRPGSAVVPAERCAQMDLLLDRSAFRAPAVLQSSEDTIVFSVLAGPTLGEIGEDSVTTGTEEFANAWEEWSRAWLAQLNAASDARRQPVLDTLPVHSPQVEAKAVARWLNRWLRHTENVPALSTQRGILVAMAEHVTAELLRTAPDPLVWSHGDLHDRQIIAPDGLFPLGLLDFDDAAQAEAARDLAILDVHLELRGHRNSLTPARYRKAHAEVLAVARQLQVSPARFDAYSDACWLRLACSALPPRSSLATAVLDERIKHKEPEAAPTPVAGVPTGSRG